MHIYTYSLFLLFGILFKISSFRFLSHIRNNSCLPALYVANVISKFAFVLDFAYSVSLPCCLIANDFFYCIWILSHRKFSLHSGHKEMYLYFLLVFLGFHFILTFWITDLFAVYSCVYEVWYIFPTGYPVVPNHFLKVHLFPQCFKMAPSSYTKFPHAISFWIFYSVLWF